MAETPSVVSFRDLPYHLILEILISGRLRPIDLVNIELTSKIFGWGGIMLICHRNYVNLLICHTYYVNLSQVFTCGRNYNFSCGHLEEYDTIYIRKLVEALKTIPCKQVATGLYSTVFLTREGHVYTVGGNACGQLGHGDTMNKKVPSIVEVLKNVGPVVQISAGPQYVLAVTEDGSVYSFEDGYDLCLGHGDSRDKFKPHAIEAFRTKGVHILNVSAGDRHVAAIGFNGDVYTWSRFGSGSLGHGDRKDLHIPEIVLSLKNHLAVQVCARKINTFVLTEGGLVYGLGSGFGKVPVQILCENGPATSSGITQTVPCSCKLAPQ